MTFQYQLNKVGVLITRPEHQADYLMNKIAELGGAPWLFPVLAITDIDDKQPLLDLIARLSSFDIAIFVSPNAVDKAMLLIKQCGTWPPLLIAATVGQGSANMLKSYGVETIVTPNDGSDSEALLGMPLFQQVADKRVVIFRGEEGRKLLGDTLSERGADVEYIACYRRSKPAADVAPLLAGWRDHKIHAVVITSSEGLNNLFDMLGETGQQLLRITPLFTAHERIAQKARELGIATVCCTPGGDNGIIQGLLSYFNHS
ncbi:Uroporphyrinogen III synthase HEM4 [Nitrosomonas mobilis]|uniref:Uroporphyrinogen-III synthase n=2 Tax=Nitrosomonas mobilis TaxID=51642 RepID=A0A1G5SIS9_9PROT|nr:Uroporphyrinogen III synthase HEM4 [Nitrosomonas mobilis]